MKMKLLLTLILGLVISGSLSAETKVELDEYGGEQSIQVTFEKPVQRAPADQIPIEITPKSYCKWVWVDRNHLECDLRGASALAPASSYELSLKEGLLYVDGEEVPSFIYEFSTQRPEIEDVDIDRWLNPLSPVIHVLFNMSVQPESLQQSIFLESNRGELIELTVSPSDNENTWIEFSEYKVNTGWLLTPKERLKLNRKYQLFQTSGIKTPHGELKSVKKIIDEDIEAYGAFEYLGSECREGWRDPVKENEACTASTSLSLKFNVPIDESSADSCLSSVSALSNYRVLNSSKPLIALSVSEPNKDIKLNCLSELKDIFGRKLNRTDITIKANDFLPEALNFYEEEVLTIDDDISLFANTINIDGLEVSVGYQNYEAISHYKKLKARPGKNKVVSTKVGFEEFSGVNQISGSIWYERDVSSFNFSIQKSRYNVHLTKSNYEVLFFITDLKSGKPLKNTEFSASIFDGGKDDYKVELRTNNQGVAVATGEAVSAFRSMFSYDDKKVLLRFDDKWDTHILLTRRHRSSSEVTGELSYDTSVFVRGDETWLWGITDKPIYRPGEVVQYTVYVRELDDKKLVIPELKGRSLLYLGGWDYGCYRPKDCNSPYQIKDPQFDEYGTYTGQITLPETIDDGEYYIGVNGQKDFDSLAYFTVANYKPNTIKLTSKLKQVNLFNAPKLDVETVAEYFSGGPYSQGKAEVMVKVKATKVEDELSHLSEYTFNANSCENCSESEFYSGGKLNEDGLAVKTLTVPNTSIWFGKVQVQSSLIGAGEEGIVSREVEIPYASRPYFVGIKDSSWSSSSTEPFTIETIVVTPDGEEKNNIKVDFSLQESSSPWSRGSNEKSPQRSIDCTSRTNNTCIFRPEVEGYYDILATVTYSDGEKQTSRLKQYFYDDSSDKLDSEEMTIHADKNVYEVGSLAEITFSNPFAKATALIVVHRNKKLKHDVVDVSKGLNSYKLKITEDMAPGVDISVKLFPSDLSLLPKDPKLVDFSPSVTQRVSVIPSPKDKTFEITIDNEIKKPGEAVDITIENHSDAMKYTIAIIDESLIKQVEDEDYFDIYSSELSPDKISWSSPAEYTLSEKLYSSNVQNGLENSIGVGAAYDEGEMIVVTGSRLKRSDVGFSSKTTFSLVPNDYPSETSDQSLSNRSNQLIDVGGLSIKVAELRTLFKESAYWNPSVTVKAGGTKTIEAELPDNLASWKILVIGTDVKGDISTETAMVKTQKSLESRLNLPKQVSVDDRFEGGATVISRADNVLPKVEVATEVKAENGSVLSVDSIIFESVSAFDEKTIRFNSDVPETDSLAVTLLASSGEAEDGVVNSIPVFDTAIQRSQTYYGVLPEQKSLLLEAIPENAHNNAELTVTLSSSISSQLSGTYDYMQHYPHNCWEQTLSRALVAAYQLSSGNYQAEDEADLNVNINMALNTIQQFQAPNGGMSFFKPHDYNVSKFLSAYTLYAAEKLRVLGYHLDPVVLENLEAFVYKELKDEDLEQEMRTLFATSLSFYSGSKAVAKHHVNLTFNAREKLSHAAKGLLLESLSQYEGFEREIKTLQKDILSDVVETNKKFILEDDKTLDWSFFSYNTKSYCRIISGMVSADAPREITNKFINTALEYRRDNKGDFGNTISNAICTVAISNYINQYESKPSSSDFEFSVQGKKLRVNSDKKSKPISIDSRSNSQLEIDGPSDGNAYLEARIEYEVDGLTAKAESKGFVLEREYFVYKQGKWLKVTDGSFKRGDWVKVRLKINNPMQRRFVAVTDYVPGGFFPKDEALATSAPGAIFDNLASSWLFNEKQVGTRTAKFYADILPAGSHQIEYISQATHRGQFSAIPAVIEEMYDDDVYGSSNPVVITVK